jgi:hypothetical protein
MRSFAIASVGYLGEAPMSLWGLLGVSVIETGEVSLGPLQAALSGSIIKAPGFAAGYLLTAEHHRTSIVQKRRQDHSKRNSRAYYVADHMIDARSQTGTAPDEQTAMRYPTRASELDHRRLQVPPSPLHDPSPNQLHAGERGERSSRARGA